MPVEPRVNLRWLGRTRLAAVGKWIFLSWFTAAGAHALEPDQVAVIVNDTDPLSVEIGEYYAKRRAIPLHNVVAVTLPHERPVLSPAQFQQISKQVHESAPPDVQAYALTWLSPYRVDCMSITSAFAFGFARRFCAKGCLPTAPSPYFDSDSTKPSKDFGIRPTMVVAAATFEDAKALIDRGVASDRSRPAGTAHLVITKDKHRNSRAPRFEQAQRAVGYRIPTIISRTRGLKDVDDIMFYFTGAARVPYLETLDFLPGAIADHLTSAGGRLTGSKQMSALRWLEAGATGSYGTVVEPCNFPQKFPRADIVMRRYLDGESLIEAYWKSVVWPGQGIFIGEPLARPYAFAGSGSDSLESSAP